MPLRFLTAGESHGPALTVIIDGIPAGLTLDETLIDKELARRQHGYGAGARMKIEQDHAHIMGGVMETVTTGAPLAFLIQNRDHERWRQKDIPPFTIPRPGHADLTGAVKFGYQDLRPALERASARETAARVAAGAICRHFLAQFGIQIGGYVLSIGEIDAKLDSIDYLTRFEQAETSEVRCPDQQASQLMIDRIKRVMQEKDTLGGLIEVVALNLPPGLGSYIQWDRRLEARLGAAVLSIPAIKGVEIGPAFSNSRLPGTKVQDPIRIQGDQIVRSTNRAGGLEAGITNGQPLVIRAAFKPIATTLTPQESIDLFTGAEISTNYERSDFCPVPRAVPIVEGMIAFILADVLIEKLGGDSMNEMLPRFANLRKTKLSDLRLDGISHKYWTDQEGT